MKKILLFLAAMFAFGFQSVNAQDAIKIVTGHPDFKMKVSRCEASGKNVVLDLTVTNVGDTDIPQFQVSGGSHFTKFYDDQGNIYEGGRFIKVKIANKEYTNEFQEIKLVSGVTYKLSYIITDVSPQAETFALVEPFVKCASWSITKDTVKLRNIPITRN